MTPIQTGAEVPKHPVTNDAPVTPEDGGKVSSSAKRPRSRKRDAPPKPKAPKQDATSFTTKELEEALAEILCFPAVPCAMVEDAWGVEHFTKQGHVFAENLAKQAEKNATLHKWCVRIAQGETIGMLGMSAIMYAVPPLIHWGLIPVPAAAREMIPGMPPVKDPDQPQTTGAQHVATPPGNASNGNNAHTRQERHTP